MRKLNTIIIASLVVFLTLCIAVPQGWSGVLSPSLSIERYMQAKHPFDDPRPLYVDINWKKLTTPEWVQKLTVDQEASKKAWAEVIGFKAPDVVGKIAPEIKPGVYNYTDKDKYPGLKELMIPYHYEKFAPPGAPFVANFRQIKVIPTRQYFNPLTYSQMSMKNLDKTKQDSQGYILWKTYEGGIPWAKPAGQFKAMQVMYNQQNVPQCADDSFVVNYAHGFTKNLKQDYEQKAWGGQMKMHGRYTPPMGWYDERAKLQGEIRIRGFSFLAPRDSYGMVMGITEYLDPAKWTNQKIYIPGLRRVRTLSSTDTQDVNPGSPDSLYDDTMGFGKKMSPTIYPMAYKVIAEREYLVPSYSLEGRETFSSPEKGVERLNYEWERRPMYVIELTELDKSYVYSKRVIYIDKETFNLHLAQGYDRKGRLYRSFEMNHSFMPDAAILNMGQRSIMIDHIDMHSSLNQSYAFPDSSRMTRDLGSIEALKLAK